MLAAMTVCPLVVPVLTLWYAQSLAARIPAPWLRRATWLTLVLVIGSALALHLALANYFGWLDRLDVWWYQWSSPAGGYPSGYGRWYGDLADMIRDGCGLLLGALLVLMVIVLVWYWRAMKKQADLAKQTWAKQPAAQPSAAHTAHCRARSGVHARSYSVLSSSSVRATA